jgi:hypothetical protein
MKDESMKPEGDMPFSGQRMFWGGFDPIVDSGAGTAARNRLSQHLSPAIKKEVELCPTSVLKTRPRTTRMRAMPRAASSGMS